MEFVGQEPETPSGDATVIAQLKVADPPLESVTGPPTV